MPEARIDVDELRRGGVVKLRDRDMFSIWVKTTCCNLNSRQLAKLADISDRYARGFVLFTTRQIPIIPHVNIREVPDVQRELSEVDLELDRCGPRVRNTNVCYSDRICPEAAVNCISLAEKLESFFRSPMLHKVKIGVAGCNRDCIASRVLNDVSFVGTKERGRKGYNAYVGGRLGVNPFVGINVAELLSEGEAVRLTQNYFDLLEREGKSGERGADLIGRLGLERVKEALNRQLQEGTPVRAIDCATGMKERLVDKTTLKIRATCGEVTSLQLRTIAAIASRYGPGFVHFAIYGAPEIPGTDKKHLAEIRQALGKVGLHIMERGVGNLQSCFGAYCAEGLVDPQSLLREIERKVAELDLNDLTIRISAAGCPNSCGIAHVSDIGFHGVVEPEVDAGACSGCGLCPQVCKRKAIEITNNLAVIDEGRCRYCGQCIAICPYNAIRERRRGFAVLVGGKVGEDTRLGQVVAEFVPSGEALRIAEACLKMVKEKKACAATIIDEVGIEAFKAMLSANTGV